MGNFCSSDSKSASKSPAASSTAASNETKESKTSDPLVSSSAAAAPAKKLDPKDFFISRRTGETIIRYPGAVQGQALAIEELTDCKVLIFDNSASITIDECTNCTFYIGPCESSVFIRTVKDSKFLVAAQQIRFRDCSNVQILAYLSAGQPVIENSQSIKFGAWEMNYFGLAQQFHAANLNEWNSDWSRIHDFHGKPNTPLNWSFMPPESGRKAILGDIEAIVAELPKDEDQKVEFLPTFCVPITFGSRPEVDSSQSVLVIFTDPNPIPSFLARVQGSENAAEILENQGKSGQLKVLRTRSRKLNESEVKSMFGAGKEKWAGQALIGIEINRSGNEELADLDALKSKLESWAVETAGESATKNVTVFVQPEALTAFFEPIAV